MAAVSKSATFNASLAQLNLPQVNKHSGELFAGMTLDGGDACYIHTDGKAYKAQDTGASTLCARVHGYAARKATAGQAVTLIFDCEVAYSDASGMTPGALLYLSSSVAAGIDTAASNSHAPLGHAVTDKVAFLRKLLF
jgi:hypothetical protein